MSAELNVKERNDSRHSVTKTLRKSGKIPAVIYGKTVGNRGISVDEGEILRIFRDSGRNSVIDLSLDGQAFSAMVQDLQTDSLKGDILHIDFLEVDMNVEKETAVPLHLVGESIGQKNGGIVQHTINEVTIRSLPANIPQSIEIDISELEIGEVFKVKDIKASHGYEILDDDDEVVVSITPPQLEPEVENEANASEAPAEGASEPAGEGAEE